MPRFEPWPNPLPEQDVARLRWLIAANQMLLAYYRLEAVLRKANFDPNEPRVPPGFREGGQWTGGGGGWTPSAGSRPVRVAENVRPGVLSDAAAGGGQLADAPLTRRRFETSMDGLVRSGLLTGEEAKRFSFDPRYVAARYYRDGNGADVQVPDTARYFASKEELEQFLERNGRDGYTEVLGSTPQDRPLFTSPRSTIFGGAAHGRHITGFIQEFSDSQMMKFAIMHEYAHQIGFRTEDAANAYAAERLGIRNVLPR